MRTLVRQGIDEVTVDGMKIKPERMFDPKKLVTA
jgi:hypothetical protein